MTAPGRRWGGNNRVLLSIAVVLLPWLVGPMDVRAAVIDTVAGGGGVGDGLPALEAPIIPLGIALDAAGNVFLADGIRHVYGNGVNDGTRVRRIDAATGIITTFAGNGGLTGFCGDGGPATAACLSSATDVAVDGAGNVFLADNGEQLGVVRRVDAATGLISTVAGRMSGPCTAGPLATDVCFTRVGSIQVDAAGNLFIVVPSYYTPPGGGSLATGWVDRVDAATGTIAVVAGNGTAPSCGDGGPATQACISAQSVAIDGSGNVFVGESDQYAYPSYYVEGGRVRRVDAASGLIATVAGSGRLGFCGDNIPATTGCFTNAAGIAVGSTGDLFIATNDSFDSRVHRVDATTHLITTLAGTGAHTYCGDGGPATAACVVPQDVAVDSAANVFIADGSLRVRRVDAASGVIATVAGNGTRTFCGDGHPSTQACLDDPSSVATDAAGNLYILDRGNARIRRVDAASGTISTVAGNDPTAPCTEGGVPSAACVRNAAAITVDAQGNLYVSSGDNRVRRIDAVTGHITTVAGGGAGTFCGDGGPATQACLNVPGSIAIDEAGDLFIADIDNFRLRRVDATTHVISTLIGNGSPSTFRVGLLATGPGGTLYMTTASGIVQVDPTTGAQTPPIYGAGSGVTVDAGGNLFVFDAIIDRIVRIDATTHAVSTVAGSGMLGTCGDGGNALAACLNPGGSPAVDRFAHVFIADFQNARVRRVSCDDVDRDGLCDATPCPDADGDGVCDPCSDADGDGICDVYDLTDLPGLALTGVIVRDTVGSPTDPSGYVRVDGTLSTGAYPVTPSAIAFRDQARSAGLVLRLYAGDGSTPAPRPRDTPFATFVLPPSSCTFRTDATSTPGAGRCRVRGVPDLSLRLTRMRNSAALKMAVRFRHLDLTQPPSTVLHVVLDANETAPLDFHDAIGDGPGEACTTTPLPGGTRIQTRCD